MATGYKGLWIDDVNLIMQVGNGYGHRVAPIDRATGRPMTTNAWEKYFADFMTQVRQALPKAEILHNSLWFAGSGARGSDPYVQQEIKAADWINRESGISDTGITGDDGPWSVQEFFRFVDIVHSLGAQIDIQEFDMNGEYGIAGYFLVSNGTDAFGAGISPDKWPAVLDVDLGNPQGPRYGWKGLIRRDFENGMVLLNPPGKPTARVDVNGSYVDSNGRVVSEGDFGRQARHCPAWTPGGSERSGRRSSSENECVRHCSRRIRIRSVFRWRALRYVHVSRRSQQGRRGRA